MREIKFRAWFKVSQQMFIVKELRFKRDTSIIVITNYTGGTYPNSYEIMQYTGLKDENDKEIYEGDIVKYRDESNECQVGVVKDYGYMKIYIEAIGGDDEGNQDIELHQDYMYEVIGNIYENPELINNDVPQEADE